MVREQWSGEAKYRALLDISEAANRHLELSRVLDSVAGALQALVPIDGVGIMTREGEVFRTVAAYHREVSRGDHETELAYAQRVTHRHADASRPDGPEARAVVAHLARTRETLVVDRHSDEHGFAANGTLERLGIACLALTPLTRGDEFIGGIAFARLSATSFTPEEVGILEDISRPVASALANALAFQEIASLRARLEDENLALKEEIDSTSAVGGIIGAAAALRAVLERVSRVAATDSTVLITGETGTGKELVARAIHGASPRAGRALIKVNCAALPEGLVASELFGHEKGAFTGALHLRRGRFELAAGGTVFLDEVGELPAAVQVALLRVLQEGEFERVGGSETLHTDARVIAASNRNLEEAVREGRFRSDLFFRLDVFPIRLPSLRERREDVPLLVEYYLRHYARRVGKRIATVAPEAMEILGRYAWPGNVRELQNVVERAVILARGDVLEARDFELPSLQGEGGGGGLLGAAGDQERRRIEAALASSRGRVSGPYGAAKALGVPPSTLESRIQRLGIDKLAFRHQAERTAHD
jgi:formate hydrogenlyase transcriptional activator